MGSSANFSKGLIAHIALLIDCFYGILPLGEKWNTFAFSGDRE
jgi:hypothetical protein